MHKLADPARREGVRDGSKIVERGSVTGAYADIVCLECVLDDLQINHDLFLGEIAEREGKHVVDAMLDIAVAEPLKTLFYLEPIGTLFGAMSELVQDPYTLFGVSDGGAHTKFLTAGRSPTEALIRIVRDSDVIGLEEAHWRLSAWQVTPAWWGDIKRRVVITGKLQLTSQTSPFEKAGLSALGIPQTEKVRQAEPRHPLQGDPSRDC